MPQPDLPSILAQLASSPETHSISLEHLDLGEEDLNVLLDFLKIPRKRPFHFLLKDKEQTDLLRFASYRATSDQNAKKIIDSLVYASKSPQSKPLGFPPALPRSAIQIQHVLLSKPPSSLALEEKKEEEPESLEIKESEPVLVPIERLKIPLLLRQLQALKVSFIEDTALLEIHSHPYAFYDGLLPNHRDIHKGFFLQDNSLRYTSTPTKLPSALAPLLEKPLPIALPSLKIAQKLLGYLQVEEVEALLKPTLCIEQEGALLKAFNTNNHGQEIRNFLKILKQPPHLTHNRQDFLIPFLSKVLIVSGETHTLLLIKLLSDKNSNLDFLKDPTAQSAFFSTRGIKNLKKCLELPLAQREWWNTLVENHQRYDQLCNETEDQIQVQALAQAQSEEQRQSFDFNTFFEAYTQVFLKRITEKGLLLPKPCPIHHTGHLLITLNRVLDVLEQAEDPQEQAAHLEGLEWGPVGGAHDAITRSGPEKFKLVTSSMQLRSPEDFQTNPQLIHPELESANFSLEPWLFRYMGQHWKKKLHFSDLHTQLREIDKQAWAVVQKNQLRFILVCTFSNKADYTAEEWQKTLKDCIQLLNRQGDAQRKDLLQSLSRCVYFKPIPSLTQINDLIQRCNGLQKALPEKVFIKKDLIDPLIFLLETQGFSLLHALEERLQKFPSVSEDPEDPDFSFKITAAFAFLLQENHPLPPGAPLLLAKLHEAELTQEDIDLFLSALTLLQEKDPGHTVLHTLSQLNISKSKALPSIQEIQGLITQLLLPETHIPETDKQEAWLGDFLPQCVFGNGDLSQLDNLIVNALVESVQMATGLNIEELKIAINTNLDNTRLLSLPGLAYLKDFILREDKKGLGLMPLLDALHVLISLLNQASCPSFSEIIEKLAIFELAKEDLIQSEIRIANFLVKGEHFASLLFTGKAKKGDTSPGYLEKQLNGQLIATHDFFKTAITDFFKNPDNKVSIKGLNAAKLFLWMQKFSDTHSITFLFKEQLVEKTVFPALKKVLMQLNVADQAFEDRILDEANQLDENESAHLALQNYQIHLQAIVDYLQILSEIKKNYSKSSFDVLYQLLNKEPQFNQSSLFFLTLRQKRNLLILLIRNYQHAVPSLELFAQILGEALPVDEAAIDRAIEGLNTLFKIKQLDENTQHLFFKMSVKHNLKNPGLFPLDALNQLKGCALPKDIESQLIQQIIRILSLETDLQAPNRVEDLIQETQSFLTENKAQGTLCIALLERMPPKDLDAYIDILKMLGSLQKKTPKIANKLLLVLTQLAANKKDHTAYYLPTLLNITTILYNRNSIEEDINRIHDLFEFLPYPTAKNLNNVLEAPRPETLKAYCKEFDLNPFGEIGEKRNFEKEFASDRVLDALLSIQDLLHGMELPNSFLIKLAKKLNYIIMYGYVDPLQPTDFKEPKKLTAKSRKELKEEAKCLLDAFQNQKILPQDKEIKHLELLAYHREIYRRSVGIFPNTTQMLVLLIKEVGLSLLMRILTGEGKSVVAPMLSLLLWGEKVRAVEQSTYNPTLLERDYETYCKPYFDFFDIKSALLHGKSDPANYQRTGINCSTTAGMIEFHMQAQAGNKEPNLLSKTTAGVMDECDASLLYPDLHSLVKESPPDAAQDRFIEWAYVFAQDFIKCHGSALCNKDQEEKLESFRLFLIEKFNGNANYQACLRRTQDSELDLWLGATLTAKNLIEDTDFEVRDIYETDELGQETLKQKLCVPLIQGEAKGKSIFVKGVQQALHARLRAEDPSNARYYPIRVHPPTLAVQSSLDLIRSYECFVGFSATLGGPKELQGLATRLGITALGIGPHAGNNPIKHPPVFTSTPTEHQNAIRQAIEEVKLPFVESLMKVSHRDNFEDHKGKEAEKRKMQALREWEKTQTKPIIILCENKNEAQSIMDSLASYTAEGFTLQFLTGQEKDLDALIRRAGEANTITVGTCALARGTDFCTEHPKGTRIIQAFETDDDMDQQIAGRGARKGQPGEWIPIYQVKLGQLSQLENLKSFLIPGYKKGLQARAVASRKNQLKLQATVDRLYTEALGETQHTLMQQVQAWDSLLLECFPPYERDELRSLLLNPWREALLDQLTQAQSAQVSQRSLEASIQGFKDAACAAWETSRSLWLKKVAEKANKTEAQELKFQYLSQLNFADELTIQSPLHQKTKLFTAGSKALKHHNLETVILDKAGVLLEYTKPQGETKSKLRLAQSRELLPRLLGEFCSINPQALKIFKIRNKHQPLSYSSQLSRWVKKIFQQKDPLLEKEKQEFTQTLIAHFQKNLAHADSAEIQSMLEKFKPLLIDHSAILKSTSLPDLFKMQGLVLNFCSLYEHLELVPEDISSLKKSYSDEIMKELADHLRDKLIWCHQPEPPLFSLFEPKEAAIKIFNLSVKLKNVQNEDTIRALYEELQKQNHLLQASYLYSFSRTANLIKEALRAMDSLCEMPNCKEFREEAQDKVLCEHYLDQFRTQVSQLLPDEASFPFDHVKKHLKKVLLELIKKNEAHPGHLIHELQETIKRFRTYKAYKPYEKSLLSLEKQLAAWVNKLNQPETGLKQNPVESLLKAKTSQFAALFKTEKIGLQEENDGFHQPYIALQIQDDPSNSLHEGFTGYQSTFLSTIKEKKAAHSPVLARFLDKKAALLLFDPEALDALPQKTRAVLEKIFQLHRAMTDEADLESFSRDPLLPESLRTQIKTLMSFTLWNPKEAPKQELQGIFDSSLTSLKEKILLCKTRLVQSSQGLSTKKQRVATLHKEKRRIKSLSEQKTPRTGLLASLFTSEEDRLKKEIDRAAKEVAVEAEQQTLYQNQLNVYYKEFRKLALPLLKTELNTSIGLSLKNKMDEIEMELMVIENTLQEIEQKEIKKSSFQRRPFFKLSELLAYQAKLLKEEESIPKPVDRPVEEQEPVAVAVAMA